MSGTPRDRSVDRRSVLADLAIVAAVRLLVSLVLLAAGFEAVSDDDFARVSLAQRWAASPALDPTGTSWLPAPFWLYGTVLAALGRSLLVARATAVVVGIGAAWLVYAAGRLLTTSRPAALVGASVASLFPYGAILGAAAVPEMPTAALTLFAIATLGRPAGSLRLLGALALLWASLSRYEPWLVALGFSLLCALDVVRGKTDRSHGALAATLALVGPALWVLHNRLAHGDPLHFLGRVSAYRQALGHDPTSDSLGALLGHPLALVQKEPELALGVTFLGAAWLALRRAEPAAAGRLTTGASTGEARARRASVRDPRWLRALGLGLWLLIGLSLAAARGGAATHHLERSLLTIWLLAALFVGSALVTLAPTLRFRTGRILALALGGLLALGALVLRPWFARLDSFTHRPDEVAIGEATAARLAPAERALLEVRDYGYFAVLAGSGRPEAFVLDRDPDPRRAPEPSSFASTGALCARARSAGVRYAVGLNEPSAGREADARATVAERGAWAVWDLAASCPGP